MLWINIVHLWKFYLPEVSVASKLCCHIESLEWREEYVRFQISIAWGANLNFVTLVTCHLIAAAGHGVKIGSRGRSLLRVVFILVLLECNLEMEHTTRDWSKYVVLRTRISILGNSFGLVWFLRLIFVTIICSMQIHLHDSVDKENYDANGVERHEDTHGSAPSAPSTSCLRLKWEFHREY